MPRSETAQRVLVAAIGIPVALAAVYAGGLWLAALVVVAAVLGAVEFFRMAAAKPGRPLVGLGIALSAAFVGVAAAAPETGPSTAFAATLLLGVLAVLTAVIWTHGVEGQPMLAVATTLTGALYTGALLSYGIYLRHLPGVVSAWHGTALVMAPLVLTWVSDTFAYFVGRAWGTRKLIPRVSPGKTVQGAMGAVAGTVLVAIAYGYVLAGFPHYAIGPVQAAGFGLLISVTAQVGDLAESLFKRDAGVKNSGALLPGHGGVLDRVDSLLFTLPVAYLFFSFVVGPG